MPLYVKELLVVLVVASAVFKLGKPVALIFMSKADFTRRRNAWLFLTIVAFLSPSFWLYVLFAIPTLIIVGRRDSNPGALYLILLHVTPPITLAMPLAGMSSLFDMNNYLLLSFCVLTPAGVRILKSKQAFPKRETRWIDWSVIGYGLLTAVQYLHSTMPGGEGIYPSTVTDSMRRAFVYLFSIFMPYFVISRSNANRRTLEDSLASYCLSASLLSAIAIFESATSWLLYGEMPGRWGGTSGVEYLVRGNALRAMASAGHPLNLAALLVIACVFWFYLQTRVPSTRSRILVSVLLWVGVFITYSRGPWIGLAIAYLTYITLRRRAVSTIVKTFIGVALIGGVLSFTPLGDRIISILPFFGGKTDIGSYLYRERLLERSWEIIKEHALFGDPAALLEMKDLRQGEGIIDLVNLYVEVLLSDGFIGLALILGILLIGVLKANALRRQLMQSDAEMALLGAMLMACVLGFLGLMAGDSLRNGNERIYFLLGALVAAYVAVGKDRLTALRQQPASLK
jgi:O-antigen ligase